MNKLKNRILLLISTFFIFYGCAPSFTEFQGADLVGKKNIVITSYMSSTSADDLIEENDEESMPISGEDFQDTKGLRFAYGLNDRFDVHLKYESIKADGGFVDGSVMSIGLKSLFYSNGKHRFSWYFPISHSTQNANMINLDDGGSNINSQSNRYQTIEPTIIGSSNFYRNFDLNYSAKMLIQIGGDEFGNDENGYAFNVSGSFPVGKLDYLTFIPEFGTLIIDDQSFSHLGLD